MPRQLTSFVLALGVFVAGSVAQADWEAGVAALRAKDYEEAAREFKTVVDQQPEWAPGHRMLGQVLIKLEQTGQALVYLHKAYDLAPADPATQLALGQAYVEASRYAGAASILGQIDRSVLQTSQQGTLDQLLAVALSKSGHTSLALDALERAASASPSDSTAQFQYGVAALNDGDLGEAIRALGAAVRLKPDARNQKALVQALMQQGRRSSGSTKTDSYRRAAATAASLTSSDGSFDNLLMLAGAALGAKQFDDVISAARRASRLDSSDWLPDYYLGQAYTQIEHYGSAEIELRKALDKATLSSDKALVWGQLGHIFEKRKAFDEAILSYNQAGDSTAADRVAKNKETEIYNSGVEAEEEERRKATEEIDDLKKKLLALSGASDPPIL